MSSKLILPRRDFLKMSGAAFLAPGASILSSSHAQSTTASPSDYTLHIATGNVELAPGHVISTTLYNGQFPGPLLKFAEGRRVVVDIYNDTDIPEVAHWHGQTIPSEVDGAIEEGTPTIAPHGMRRISFVPKPAGFRFLHTHVLAGANLHASTWIDRVGENITHRASSDHRGVAAGRPGCKSVAAVHFPRRRQYHCPS